MDGLLFFVQFISLRSRARTTRRIRGVYKRVKNVNFLFSFLLTSFCLMGDFNGYVGVTPGGLISPHAYTNEAV